MTGKSGGLAAADSEIALTALLAATVTAYPSPNMGLYPAVKLAALALLVLTLVKRVAVLNGLTDADAPLRWLTHLMDPATYVAYLYLVWTAAAWALGLVAEATPEAHTVWFVAAVPVATFAVFLVSEVAFGAPLREGERIFAASAEKHRGEVLGGILRGFSRFVADSRTPGAVTHQSTLTDLRFYDLDLTEMSPEQQWTLARNTGVTLAAIALALLAYAAMVAGAVWLAGVGVGLALLLLFDVLVVSAYFRIWYSNYGLVQVENRNGHLTVLGDLTTFAFVLLLVT